MWRPSAILLRGTDLGKNLPLCDRLSYGNRCQGLFRKVSVESKKLLRTSHRMLYDHNGPVIKRGRVVRDRIDCAVEWCVNIGTGGNEKIDSKVHGAAFVGGVAATTEQRRRIKQPRFIIPANAYDRVDLLQLPFNRLGKCRRSGVVRIRS